MGLSWLLAGDAPGLSAMEPAPWAGEAPDDILTTVAQLLRPLVRAVMLAGYRPTALDIVRVGSKPSTVRLDDFGQLAAPGTVDYTRPSSGSGLVLTVTDMIHGGALVAVDDGAWLDPRAGDPELDLRAVFSHALPVPAAPPALGWPGLTPASGTDASLSLVLWSAEDFFANPWRNEIQATATSWATVVTATVKARAGTGDLTPRSRAGLLWLFNPLFWYARDPTFPGTEFNYLIGPPTPELVWPEALAAATLDPLAADLPPPADPALAEIVRAAGAFSLVLLAAPEENVEALVFDGMQVDGRWRRGNLRDLLEAALPVNAPYLARQLVYGVRAAGGDALGDAAFFGDWLDALLLILDAGLIAPAGLSSGEVTVVGSLDYEEFFGVDPVTAEYFPTDTAAFERVMLSLAGLPVVTISATQHCEAPLLRAMAWDYLIADDRSPLTIVIVAGPGVAIYPAGDRGNGWELEIIRVWDYETVPSLGSRIQPEQFLQPLTEPWEPDSPDMAISEDGMPLFAMLVYPHPRSVVFEYPAPVMADQQPAWRLTVDVADTSETSRIAYAITFGDAEPPTYEGPGEDTPTSPSIASIQVWVSEHAEVRLDWLDGTAADAPAATLEVWRIPDAAQLPPGNGAAAFPLHGAPLPHPDVLLPPLFGPDLVPATPLPAGARRVELPAEPDPLGELAWMLFTLGVDIGIGQIPIVGDVVDVVEFGLILATGKDKWGRPLTFWEQMFYLVALAPGISSGMTKLMSQGAEGGVEGIGFALELSRGQNRVLLAFVDAVYALPHAMDELFDLVGISRSFNRFDLARQARVLAGLSHLDQYLLQAERIGRSAGQDLAGYSKLAIVDLLTDGVGARAFWLPALQRPFRRWCLRHGHAADEAAVLAWMTTTRGVPRAILEALLGNTTLDFIDDALVAVRSPRISALWPSMAHLIPKGAAQIAESVANAAHYDTGRPLIDVVTAAGNIAARVAAEGRHLGFPPADGPRLAGYVRTLLANLEPGTPLGEALAPGTMQRLLGATRALEPDDMAELLVRGMHLLDEQFARLSASHNVDMTMEMYLKIHGSESFFKDLLTQSGYEHGSLMETMVAAEECIRLLKLGDVAPWELISLQSLIGTQKGPDMLRVVDGMLQIVESKSWSRIWFLLDEGGSAETQLWRYVDAIINAQLSRSLYPGGAVMPPHPEIIFRIDPTAYIDMCIRRQLPVQSMADIEAKIMRLEELVAPRLEALGMKALFEINPLSPVP